jgi:hypothetical protein
MKPRIKIEIDKNNPVNSSGAETERIQLVGDRGVVLGVSYISYAMGQAFAHGTEMKSSSAKDLAVLFSAMRARLRERGFSKVALHFENDTPDRLRLFWSSCGAKKVLEVWEMELKSKKHEIDELQES